MSGSKIIVFIFGVLIFASCTISKKVTDDKDKTAETTDRNKVWNPETGKYELATPENTKVDTVDWSVIADESDPPIRDSDLARAIPYSEKKPRYNISLLLPLRGKQFNTLQTRISSLTEKFIHFYAGFKMGLNKLEREGIDLNVNILDVGSLSTQSLRNNPAIKSSDLIIGPYRRENISEMAEFSKENQIPIITPWSSFSNLGDDNPYFILSRPTFDTYCEAIVDDVMKRFNPRDVKIVIRKGDEYLYDQFHKFTNKYGIEDTSESFRTYVVEDTTLQLSETPVDSHLVEDHNNVFIIPYYRSSDERFVYSFTRRLSIGNLNYSVYIYGMPQWKTRVHQDYDLYNSMKIYIPSVGITQMDSWDFQQIREASLREYGVLPSDDLLEAYDLVVYTGRMLFKYGKNFQYFMDVESHKDRVFSYYQFQRMLPSTSSKSIDDRLRFNTGFENKAVVLVQLKDFKFMPID